MKKHALVKHRKPLIKNPINEQKERRKLFNRFFYQVMRSHLSLEYNLDIPKVLLRYPPYKKIVQDLVRIYVDPSVFPASVNNLRKGVNVLILEANLSPSIEGFPHFSLPLTHFRSIVVNGYVCERLRGAIVRGLDLKLHKLICTEALNFVSLEGNEQVLEMLFSFAFAHILSAVDVDLVSPEVTEKTNSILFDTTAEMVDNYILTVPWQEELNKLSASLNRGFQPVKPLKRTYLISNNEHSNNE